MADADQRSRRCCPKAAPTGPLRGQRVAILGAPRDGALAHRLAGAGARIVASVGTTTTLLVISADQPFGRFAHASPPHRRAEDLRRAGSMIEIITEAKIRDRIGETAPLTARPIAS